MKMDDVNEKELMNVGKEQVQQNIQPISDEELIARTKATFEGQDPREVVNEPVKQTVEYPKKHSPELGANYWEIDGLPSKGILYPEGTRIMARPLKVLEVKKIASINEDNGDFVINDVLRRAIRLYGIEFNDLCVADKIYILLFIRANTYRDSGYVVDYMCTKCEKRSQFHFDVDDLEIQYVSDDYSPNKEITLPSGDRIKYRYLTIGDELYVDRFVELNSETIMEVDPEIVAIAHMLTSINGDSNKELIKKYYWLTNMDPGSFSYLIGYIEKNGMGVKPYINATCKKCGGVGPVPITFQGQFFLPSYQFE